MRTDALPVQQMAPPATSTAELLQLWFGDDPDDARVAAEQSALWWGHHAHTDDELRARFGALAATAATGELDSWSLSPRGRLALVLLLDQLPRAIHRGSPLAFATDARARRLTLQALEVGADRGLRPIERVFLLLPLEHAEDLTCQNLSVARFRALAHDVPEAWRATFEGFVDYAVRHREVIVRFGRFPHRNAILGRPSTPDEIAFLEEPGSSF
jgi:uncharacterized protein (DUF924 family)